MGSCLFIPSAGLAQEAAAGDLALSTQLVRSDGLASTDDLVIGQKVTFTWANSNGNVPSPYMLHVVWSAGPSGPLQAYESAVVWYWGRGDDDCTASQGPGGVTEFTLSCPAYTYGSYFSLAFIAHAPGHFALTATLSGPDPDADVSNNTYFWEAGVNCSITGTPGDDYLMGTEGADSICGGDGNDHLIAFGSGGEDWLFGQDGDDLFSGTKGAEATVAVGGPGVDTVSYENADHGMIICQGNARYAANISVWAPNALVDNERFIGSSYGDLFVGSSENDYFVGRAGPDRFVGRGGNDQLFGNTGNDRFISRDRRRDVIRGGLGRDLVQADSVDTVRSATRVTTKPFVDLCAG